MGARLGLVICCVVAAEAAAPLCASAAPNPPPTTPTSIKLTVRGTVRSAVVRVTTQARDCSAPPTIRVVAEWRAYSTGKAPTRKVRHRPATLTISGLEDVIRARPGPIANLADRRIEFPRAARSVGRSRIRATVVADWLFPREGESCYVVVPALIGARAHGSMAVRGVSRLRTAARVSDAQPAPARTTLRDHVWTCKAADFDCGARVTLASAPADGDDTDNDDQDNSSNSMALLGVLGGGLLAAAAAGASRSRKGDDMADNWDDIARKALSAEAEPIAANATNLTKFAAPTVAIATAVITLLLGNEWKLDPSRSEVIFAAAIITAAALLGIYYAFASDIRTRGAVTVARFDALASILGDDIGRLVSESETKRDLEAAQAAKSAADKQLVAAESERDAAEAALKECRAARETAERLEAERRLTDAQEALAACEAARDAAVRELDEARSAASRRQAPETPSSELRPSQPVSIPLPRGVTTTSDDTEVVVVAIELIGAEITRWLVLDAGGEQRWLDVAGDQP